NAAIFDAANRFKGCIPGIHEILRRQGLLAGRWCLDAKEDLSSGQAQEIGRVCRAYPGLNDDRFVAANLDRWLR
ncbi:MAG: dihydrodipicolinate synthase family protein, partial [Gemmatimonadota bacterium]